jgi:acyl carrier protein
MSTETRRDMNVESQIREFIQRELYFAEDSTLTDDASFLETGVVDSMGVMELVGFLQTRYGLSVPPEDLIVANFDSISKLGNYVRRRLSLPKGSGAVPRTADSPTPPFASANI